MLTEVFMDEMMAGIALKYYSLPSQKACVVGQTKHE